MGKKRPKSKASFSDEEMEEVTRRYHDLEEKEARGEWVRNSYRAVFDNDDPENWSSLEMMVVDEIELMNRNEPDDKRSTLKGFGITQTQTAPSGKFAPEPIRRLGEYFGVSELIAGLCKKILAKNGRKNPTFEHPSPWPEHSEPWFANQILGTIEMTTTALHKDMPIAALRASYLLGFYYASMGMKANWERAAIVGAANLSATRVGKHALSPEDEKRALARWLELRPQFGPRKDSVVDKLVADEFTASGLKTSAASLRRARLRQK